jgi:hypothetical protein
VTEEVTALRVTVVDSEVAANAEVVLANNGNEIAPAARIADR